ncbi:MAG TPA: lysophospholipid acyltransferase family protein [Terracidiphilus sp.]|nr:lysophospholipid acyltransferase family protein [Terracidiphilus sp.]
MIFRTIRRAVALVLALALSIFRYWLIRLRGPLSMERHALWGQQTARTILAGVGIHYSVKGTPPTHGLVISNHLSYLDVPILAAAMPCFFVAKIEIGGWPIFGWAARACGTIFLDRNSRESAMSVADQMVERLKLQIPVLLFPEGTSTDGSQLLPFHPRLIDPATSTGTQITTAAVHYVIEDGTPEKELCWYGDESFTTHLLKVLGVAGFSAEVRFGEPHIYNDRRVAADSTRAEIAAMREEMAERQGIGSRE